MSTMRKKKRDVNLFKEDIPLYKQRANEAAELVQKKVKGKKLVLLPGFRVKTWGYQ